MKKAVIILLVIANLFSINNIAQKIESGHTFNGSYQGQNLDRIAFPIGGMGAGMFCLEGTGAISHMSIRHQPDITNEPVMFAAISIKGMPNSARVLEGPIPNWKKYGLPEGGSGAPFTALGLARFKSAIFQSRFPFGEIKLADSELPVAVTLTGWSPFIPTDADNSSLPVGALEYRFKNTSTQTQEYVFSYSTRNFMHIPDPNGNTSRIKPIHNGYILHEEGPSSMSEKWGDFAIYLDDQSGTPIVDHCWFRGVWYDPLTVAWKNIRESKIQAVASVDEPAPGATLFLPFTLKPGEEKKIRVLMAWYVPNSNIRLGRDAATDADKSAPDKSLSFPSPYYKPWYSHKFKSIDSIADYWQHHITDLRQKTELFTNAFYKTTLPPEVLEAVSANLSILKSPTVLRQFDGRFWGWEGSHDHVGSCEGSCTHVWNYAQALCHLFPALERSLRETEFNEDQDKNGHQAFRAALPIRPETHELPAAADGQLGGIMKVYREWRISGDSTWLATIFPKVKISMDYCIRTWDPHKEGAIKEPHHNTYDIEFWGAEPLATGMYCGALEAFTTIGKYLGQEVSDYITLQDKARHYLQDSLYNGEYFYQKVQWTGLEAKDPILAAQQSFFGGYSADGLKIFEKEGPRYQYGTGCLSDGVFGAFMARVCGLPEPFDSSKIDAHLSAVYRNNFKKELSDHSNPQRPTYALGDEGGLLLCSWPKGGMPSLPFGYSNEVWTGIEYQVASHLIFTGRVKEGLDIVRACRKRYDGIIRNPYDEYECGDWYARAMSSYALIEALTGVRYDAVEKTLYVGSRIGDFTSFLSTDTGFGTVVRKNGRTSLQVLYGSIPVVKTLTRKP